MHITHHAAQRFLERVMGLMDFSRSDTYKASQLLAKLLDSIVVTGKKEHIVLPGFENFVVVYKDNSAITIKPKHFPRHAMRNKVAHRMKNNKEGINAYSEQYAW